MAKKKKAQDYSGLLANGPSWLGDVARFPHELAVYTATGQWPAQLYEQAALGKSPMPWQSDRPDLPVHALASQLMAQRFGVPISYGMGINKEVIQGLLNLLTEGKFVSPSGFSPEDIRANRLGLIAAQKRKRR